MIIFHNKHKAHAFWGAAFVLLATLMFTGCKQSAGGSDSGIVGTVHEAPFIEGGASLILSPNKLTIGVTAVTSDGSAVAVEGCTETELTSGTQTVLHAKGTRVILKGNIIKLDCGSNQLTALNVQGCTALQRLDCSGNRLTALNVQDCTALQVLLCVGNQLTALNVQDCTALQGLNCLHNQLTALNVQNCAALKVLDCRNNQLTSLDVQGCTALQRLEFWGNQLTTLDVQGCTSLEKLDCYNNRLTALNAQGCTALKKLGCGGEQLTTLNVQGCTALKTLWCFNNQLTAEAFTKIFNDLPTWTESDNAKCYLYIEEPGVTEGNCTDFTSPPDLAAAFDNAKNNKKWKMYKIDADGFKVEI